MSRNITFVLMYHRHKLLDLEDSWYPAQESNWNIFRTEVGSVAAWVIVLHVDMELTDHFILFKKIILVVS
jgi:hypothetical protein